MKKILCPYCGKEALWVSNEKVYGKRYGKSYMCYYCPTDEAYVGCHNNTRKPLGTMANKELRDWRIKAHAKIDPLWRTGSDKTNRNYRRKKLYQRLKELFGHEVHVGESDIEMCKKIIEIKLV